MKRPSNLLFCVTLLVALSALCCGTIARGEAFSDDFESYGATPALEIPLAGQGGWTGRAAGRTGRLAARVARQLAHNGGCHMTEIAACEMNIQEL